MLASDWLTGDNPGPITHQVSRLLTQYYKKFLPVFLNTRGHTGPLSAVSCRVDHEGSSPDSRPWLLHPLLSLWVTGSLPGAHFTPDQRKMQCRAPDSVWGSHSASDWSVRTQWRLLIGCQGLREPPWSWQWLGRGFAQLCDLFRVRHHHDQEDGLSRVRSQYNGATIRDNFLQSELG